MKKSCKWDKENTFSIIVSCNDINRIKEKIKLDQLQTLQKTDVSVPYEELIKKVKVTQQSIFSEIWKEKIRPLKDEIKCLDPHKRDPILITQQAQNW